ncbi:Protein TIFY 8 [Acorus calamus]|uniref:Protein TIFY n=1 Tax=Acorus calamus TaxID=4465 RepID=A0AAV9C1W1_ACOCL|nr:Protein TIFY 8 [Acorus calamus]
MAVAMMEEEEENPVLHDFLGPTPVAGGRRGGGGASSSGAGGPVSGGSELGSEIQMEKNFEGMHSHRFDTDGRLSGRKRSNSDSSFMDLTREHMLNMASSSCESSRHVKVFEKETLIARQRRPHVDDIPHSIQPPRMTSSSSHPFINSRMDSISSKWDHPLPPMNPVHMPHHPSRFSQLSPYGDKSSSYAYRDSCMGATLVTPPAADEGSRTGIKGSQILDIVKPCTENADRNSTGALCNSNRARSTLQGTEMDFSNTPSRNNLTTATRQMTIFYAGQAHVFDDVHPNKADIIMALAGSNGGSWSTTLSPKPTSLSPLNEAKVLASQNDISTSKLFSQNTHTKLSIPGNSSHDHVPRVSVGDSPKQTNEGQTSRPVEDARHVT